MSEFIYVLIASVIILVAGGILAGYAPQTTDGVTDRQQVFFEHIGTLGEADSPEATFRDIDLGSFVVNETSPNATVYEQDEVRFGSSVFGASTTVIEFDAFDPQAAYFTFVPTTGTATEHLIMTVNGQEIPVPEWNSGSRVTIPIDADLLQQGSNVIQLEAQSPGAAFWRSPDYVFQNAELVLNDLENDRVVRPFRAYDYEINGFDQGELQFSITEDAIRDRPLDIRLNGNPVATRTPVQRAMPYTVTFFSNTTGLRPGENVLTFKTEGASQYPLSNVRARLSFFAGDRERTVLREFDLAEDQYNRLGEDTWAGQLSFNVDRIFLEQPLRIEMTDGAFEFTPTPQENTRTFTQEHVSPGENTLRLATDGSYRITDFNMSLVKQE